MCSYLQILLPVENNGLSFDFSVLDVHLVATKNNWNVLTYTNQVSVPVGNIFVSNTRGHIKHDDGTLSLEIVKYKVALMKWECLMHIREI